MRTFLLAPLLLSLALACGGGGHNVGPVAPVEQLPVILVSPASQSVWSSAGIAVFSVQVQGSNLLYQWWRSADGVDTKLDEKTASTLTLSPIGLSYHQNKFWVTITNGAGTVTSGKAELLIKEKPSIQTHPQSWTGLENSIVSLSVRASGTPPLTYVWKKNGTVLSSVTGTDYSFTATLANNGDNYWVEVHNRLEDVDWQATSNVAVLKVGTLRSPPAITQQPQNLTMNVGQTGSIYVVASGSEPLAYQWYKDGNALAGANSSRLAFTDVQSSKAGNYAVRVSNDVDSLMSQTAVLTIRATAPFIVRQPVSTVVGTGQAATFSVVAEGSPPLLYQWLRNGLAIANAYEASYTTPPATLNDDQSRYTVRVSNAAASVDSEAAELRVYLARTIAGVSGVYQQTTSSAVWVPMDGPATRVTAIVEDGVGGFTTYSGTADADGNFSIPAVPPGSFLAYLRPPSGPSFGIRCSSPYLDLRQSKPGRAGAALAKSPLAAIGITLQGELGGEISRLQAVIPNLAMTASQEGGGPTFQFPWAGLPLIQSPDDLLWIVAQKDTKLGADVVTRTQWASDLAPFDQPTMSEYAVTLNPQALVQDRSLEINVNQDAYASMRSWMHPAAAPADSRGPLEVVLGAQPYTRVTGPFGPSVPVLRYVCNQTGMLATGTTPYGDPFPADWKRAVVVKQYVTFSLPVGIGGRSVKITDAFEEFWALSSWKSEVHAPGVQPVDSPRIGGVNLFEPPASVGTRPVLSWSIRDDSPAISYCKVDLFEVTDTNTLDLKANFICEGTSFSFPPDCLLTGHLYVVRITAVKDIAQSMSLPYRQAFPSFAAPVYSSVLRP